MKKFLALTGLACAWVIGTFAEETARDWFDAGIENGFPNSAAMKGGAWCAAATSRGTYDQESATLEVTDDNLEFEANCARGLDKQVSVDMKLAFDAYAVSSLPDIPEGCKGGVTVGYVVSGENDATTNYYYCVVTKTGDDVNGWAETSVPATPGADVFMKISYKVEDGKSYARYELGETTESLTALTAAGSADGWFEIVLPEDAEKAVQIVNYTGSGKVKHLSSLAEPLPALVVFGAVVTTPGRDLCGSTVTVALDQFEPYDENPTFELRYDEKSVAGEVVENDDGSKSVRFVIPAADARPGDLIRATAVAVGTAAYDGTTTYEAASAEVTVAQGTVTPTGVDPSLAADANGVRYETLAEAVANGAQPIRLVFTDVTLPADWDVYYDETDGTAYLRLTNAVARIGIVGYASLDKAFAAARSGDTVVLGKDVTLAEGATLTIPAGVALDLYDDEKGAAYAIVDSEGAFLGGVDSTAEGNAVILRNESVTVGGAAVDVLDAVLDAALPGSYRIAANAGESPADVTANGVVFAPGTVFSIVAATATEPLAVTVTEGLLSIADDLALADVFGAGNVSLAIPSAALAVTETKRILLAPGDRVTSDDELTVLATETTGYEVVESVVQPEEPVAPEEGGEEPSDEEPLEESATFVYTVAPVVYTITYLSRGDAALEPTEYTIADTPVTLPTPTRAGYSFKEWHDAEGHVVTAIPEGRATNLEFTAVWTKSSFRITYATAFGAPSASGKTVAGTLGEDGYSYTLTADDLAVTVSGADGITDWKFVGWDAKPGDVIANDVVISAVWKQTGFTVHVAERGPGVDFTNTTVRATIGYDELPDGFEKDGVVAEITYTRKDGGSHTVTGTIVWNDETHSAEVEFERFDVDASQGGAVVIKTKGGAELAKNEGEILSAQEIRWIAERPGTGGVNYNVTGTWGADGFTALAEAFDVCGASFTAKRPSQGPYVEIYAKMTFEGTTEYETLPDWSEMKAGIILARAADWTLDAPTFNFVMLSNGETWNTNTVIHARDRWTYDVHVVLNYLDRTVRYSLMDTDEAGNTVETILGVYPNAKVMDGAANGSVRDVRFPGPGLLAQLDGDYWSSNVAKDTNGVEYATVDAAANYGGEITLLWDATYNRGGKPIWRLRDAGRRLFVNGVSEQWQIPVATEGRVVQVKTSNAGDADGVETLIGPIFVPDSWVAARLGEDATDDEIIAELNAHQTAEGENGLRAWQNFVLGIEDDGSLVMNGRASTAVPADSAREGARSDDFIVLDSATLSDPEREEPVSGLKVSYRLQTSADHVTWTDYGEPSPTPAITVDLGDAAIKTATYWRINIIYTER